MYFLIYSQILEVLTKNVFHLFFQPDKHDRRSQLFSRLPASPFSNKDQANSSTSGQQAQNSSSTMNAEAAENPEVVVVKGKNVFPKKI